MTKVLLLLSVIFIATSSLAGSVSLSETLKLTPGKSTKQQLIQLFGKPDKINTFKEPPLGESWEYRENGIIKLSVYFVEKSEIADSLDWGTSSNDPEKDLKVAKARFPKATWDVETTKWINPHAFPSECYYQDNALGVSLELNLRRREVDTIRRWNPERKLASKEDEKPPVYCLGREPNTGCARAISAKVFFRDQSITEYCDNTK